MPKLTFSSPACHTWEMQVDMDDATETLPSSNGGIILKNVKHDDYNLAKDIRVTRIWIFGHDGEKEIAEDFKLIWKDDNHNTPGAQFDLLDFRLKSDGKKIKAGTDQVHQNEVFRRYAPIGYIVAKYKIIHKPESYFFKVGDEPFYFEQRVLMCDYGRNPAHEPGAVLDAARFFPLTSFLTNNPKVLRVRVDYRTEAGLDVFLRIRKFASFSESKSAFPQSRIIKTSELLKTILHREPTVDELAEIKGKPNQAGIFRDDEGIPDLITGGIEVFANDDLLDDLFFAGEKPVPYEIVASGLINGRPGSKIGEDGSKKSSQPEITPLNIPVDQTTWDNIHIWGGFDWKDGEKPLPSSPGAFHSFHLHWRWGYVSGYPSVKEKLKIGATGSYATSAFGDDQFKGVVVGKYPDVGGALVDSRLKNQSIVFALTRTISNTEYSWAADDFPSSEIFRDLFAQNLAPRALFQGTNIIFWLSFEAIRDKNLDLFAGTLFIHGFYFAHNPEQEIKPAKYVAGKPLFQYGGGKHHFDFPEKVLPILERDADGKFLEKK
jgi:hypothetical protein